VSEAERQIRLILNPPTAEVGQTYLGKVVNLTKFGAFVNILPGRDGLLHISKMGGGKRIERVEDVLSLGDEVEVKVDDVDPNGKVSLSPVAALTASGSGGGDAPAAASSSGGSSEDAPAAASDREYVSFEDSFEAEIAGELGDLGPGETSGGRGGDRNGGGGGDRSGGQRRRRR